MLVIVAKLNEPLPLENPRIFTNDTNLNGYLNSVVNVHGGIPEDYYIATLNETSPNARRILGGDEYTLIWTNNRITGADFTTFDAKGKIRFNSNKLEFLADNVDKCRVQVRLQDANDVDLTTTMSGVYFSVTGPLGECTKKVDLISGVVIFDFKTTLPGKWQFPSAGVYQINNYRVRNPVVVEALLP